MSHAYTEDQQAVRTLTRPLPPGEEVELPAKRLPAVLGWHWGQSHPHLGPLPEGEEPRAWVDETGLFGRETKGEVVLVSRLRVALERLNSTQPPEAITAAADELTRDRSAMGLPGVNREVYRLLEDGIALSVADQEAPPSPVPLLFYEPSPLPLPTGEEVGEEEVGEERRTEPKP